MSGLGNSTWLSGHSSEQCAQLLLFNPNPNGAQSVLFSRQLGMPYVRIQIQHSFQFGFNHVYFVTGGPLLPSAWRSLLSAPQKE